MVVENNKIEKICCFYVSDFHLEMILVPYINAHINENIVIITENDFNETVGILVSKMNLKKENKEIEKELKLEEGYIKKRTGIETRYYLKNAEDEIDMAKKIIELDKPLNGICAGFNNILIALGTDVIEDKTKSHDIYDKDSSISYIKDVNFERENDN